MSENAKRMIRHLNSELGEYQSRKPIPGEDPADIRLWKVSDIDTFLTKNKLTEEEIIYEYRERMVLLDTHWRNEAKALTATLRQQYRPTKDWTEQKVFEAIKGGFADDDIAVRYSTSVNVQNRS